MGMLGTGHGENVQDQAGVGAGKVEEEDGRRGKKEIPYPKVTPAGPGPGPAPDPVP